MKKAFIIVLAMVFSVTAFAADKWPSKLNFGVIPVASQSSLEDTFGYMTTYLSTQLGMPVDMQQSSDYAAVITAMQFGKIDCAYFGPKSYVEAALRAKAEALVIEVSEDGSQGYHGIIITKAGSGLNKLDDLKGKTWAFTDSNSTSGTLVPSVYFAKLGITPTDYFSKVIYSGGHEASILSVKNSRVDGASTNDLDFARGEGIHWKKDDFNILWTSDLIPGAPVACRSDLPQSLKMAVKGALVSWDDKKGLGALKVAGYYPTTDKTYDTIRELNEIKKKLAK